MSLRPAWATQGDPVLQNKEVSEIKPPFVGLRLLGGIHLVCVSDDPSPLSVAETYIVNHDIVTLCSKFFHLQEPHKIYKAVVLARASDQFQSHKKALFFFPP